MAELLAAAGSACATDQILYKLMRRGPEHDLLLRPADHALPIMACNPIERARLVFDPALCDAAKPVGATPAQVARAWMLCREA